MKKGESNTRKNKAGEQIKDTASARIPGDDRQAVNAAHEQAEKDMQEDPELTASSPNDDLDEGETARLGEDKTDVI
jgi:hypothetical protein